MLQLLLLLLLRTQCYSSSSAVRSSALSNHFCKLGAAATALLNSTLRKALCVMTAMFDSGLLCSHANRSLALSTMASSVSRLLSVRVFVVGNTADADAVSACHAMVVLVFEKVLAAGVSGQSASQMLYSALTCIKLHVSLLVLQLLCRMV
jgi:hypothetical protein